MSDRATERKKKGERERVTEREKERGREKRGRWGETERLSFRQPWP